MEVDLQIIFCDNHRKFVTIRRPLFLKGFIRKSRALQAKIYLRSKFCMDFCSYLEGAEQIEKFII